MTIDPLNLGDLHACLIGLAPVELKRIALLRERRSHRQFFPQFEGGQVSIPREVIAEAVTAFSILEYGL